jgi:hypothetical protein
LHADGKSGKLFHREKLLDHFSKVLKEMVLVVLGDLYVLAKLYELSHGQRVL